MLADIEDKDTGMDSLEAGSVGTGHEAEVPVRLGVEVGNGIDHEQDHNVVVVVAVVAAVAADVHKQVGSVEVPAIGPAEDILEDLLGEVVDNGLVCLHRQAEDIDLDGCALVEVDMSYDSPL